MTRTEPNTCDHKIAIKDGLDDVRLIRASELIDDRSDFDCVNPFNFCPDCGTEIGSTFAKWQEINLSAFDEISNLQFKKYPDIEKKRARFEMQLRDESRDERNKQIDIIMAHHEARLKDRINYSEIKEQEPT